MRFRIIAALIAAALVVVVTLQNNAPVDLHFLFWKARVDRLLLFPGLFAMGFLAGAGVMWATRRRHARKDAVNS